MTQQLVAIETANGCQYAFDIRVGKSFMQIGNAGFDGGRLHLVRFIGISRKGYLQPPFL
ncbi:hypothetical protein D1872_319970 [compost metagenome]